jgi:hypothetical protein
MFEDLNYTPVSVATRDRRYGNPQQQKLDKARNADRMRSKEKSE